MKTIGQCACEAVCEQTQTATGYRVEDILDSRICGHELSARRGNKMLSFDLIRNPSEKAPSCLCI
jgi:hypothetical protein